MNPQQVMPTEVEKPGEPLSLMVEEPGCLAIARRVPDVVFLMGNVEVSAK